MKTLVEKYLSGRSTKKENEQLLQWLRESEHLNNFQKVKDSWEADTLKSEMSQGSKENWSSLQNEMLKKTQRELQKSVRYIRLFKYAAILVAVISIGGFLAKYLDADFNKQQYSIVKADNGQIASVVLPDQTEVWLNSGSSIKYSNEFALSNRKIDLQGEAYFNVTKNPKLPFLVKGSTIEVKVLGTKFNVSAYPDDKLFNVALEEGSVELTSEVYKKFRKKLKPGELAVFNKQDKSINIEEVNVELYTSWKDGIVNIYNLPLEEVVLKLSKRYNQKFEIDDRLKNLRYTYAIKNEPLSEVLSIMETITPVQAIQNGDIISLKYKNNK